MTAAVALIFAVGVSARASIVSTTGAIDLVANPPSDVSSNQWESNTLIRAFAEQTSLLLPQSVAVDITAPGTSPSSTDENLSAGTIAAGTLVDSYTLHFDVVGSRSAQNALAALGTITFDQPILGLMVLSDTENASNGILGLPGVTYSTGSDHGLELNPDGGGTSDSITLSADRRTVSVDLLDAYFSDDVRIITAPEPGACSLLAGALVIPAFARPRRRRV